jgi:hypothetical protein
MRLTKSLKEILMVSLNDAFDGKDPDFMDRLFPEGGWRRNLELSKARDSDWTWFWDRFAPNGTLISEDPPGNRMKSKQEMPAAVMKSVVLGLIESEEPTAKYVCGGRTLHYWCLLKKDIPDDIFEYSSHAVEGVEA